MPCGFAECLHHQGLGGLGIRDFGTQNICLLLKLVHRLHFMDCSAWAQWVRQRASLVNLKGDLRGHHWETLRAILPLYRAITTVQLGDEETTLFWRDVWSGNDALADRFPALFSHCTQKEATARHAILSNLEHAFVNRLSTQARVDLQQVRVIIVQSSLGRTRSETDLF